MAKKKSTDALDVGLSITLSKEHWEFLAKVVMADAMEGIYDEAGTQALFYIGLTIEEHVAMANRILKGGAK